MVNFGPLAAEIVTLVWGTPGNFSGFRILAALLYIKGGKVYVRSYVRNGGRGQLSSERRHDEYDVIMRTGAASAASAVEAIRHNENDVTMTIAGLWRYGDWRHVATGCTAAVEI